MKKKRVEPNHITHPFKVEARDYSRCPTAVLGRAMFKTRKEAEKFAQDPDGDQHVTHSKPGDTEFA